MRQKLKASSFACQVESIFLHSHCLLKSFETECYCRSSISSVLCDRGLAGIKVSYWQLIELALPIKSDRLQMQTLGQNNAPFGLLMCQKLKTSSFTCRVESIFLHSHRLPKSFETECYCRSLISSVFCDCGSAGIEVSYRRSIELALPINFDRLQMQMLGQNNAPFGLLRLFRCLVRASYNQDSRPHIPWHAHRCAPFCSVSTFLCMQ